MKQVAGIWVNFMHKFEQINLKFARQLTIYGWVLGAPVGSDVIIGIEQLCGKPDSNGVLLRIASHRGMVSQKYQFELALRISQIWQFIQDEHIFGWMSKEDSLARCTVLDEYYTIYEKEGATEAEKAKAKWFQDTTRIVVNY